MLARIAGLCTRHRLALLSAFALGLLVVAPQLIFRHTPVYRGIDMIGSDAEEYYVARTQEVYDGNPRLGSTFRSEKNLPYLVPGLGENITARFGQVFAQSAVTVNVCAKFFSPFIIALLVYALVYILSASVPGALLAGAFIIAGDAMLGAPTALVGVLLGHAPITSFLIYSRPINPEVSAIFFFSALLILTFFFFKERVPTWTTVGALGLLAGGALYISPYVSSFLFAFLGLSMLWFLYRRDYVRMKAFMVSITVGLIALVPFLLNFLALHQNPFFAETSIRQGLIHTHTPVIGFWIVLLVVSLFVWPRRFLASRPFFAIGIVALVVLLNQQIVTGLGLQSAHYHWYITKPFVGMVLALFAVFLIEWVSASKIVRYILYAGCFSIFFISAAAIQRDSYNEHYKAVLGTQAYAPVFSFLQTLSAGQSVWANRVLSLYTPMYTKQDAPNNDYAEYDPVSQAFLESRLFLEYTLRKISSSDAFAVMQAEREDIASRIFGVYWRDQHGSYSAIPDSLLGQYATQYKNMHQSVESQLSTLGISIIVWDKEADPSWDVGRVLDMTPVFSNDRFEVYQLATTTSL